MDSLWYTLPLSYLVGSFPTAYLLVKWVLKKDIRTLGSGNMGATNVLRHAGPKLGFAVLAIDVLKGWGAVILLTKLIPSPEPVSRTAAFLVGLGAIFGHVFTPFLGFKGGKGVATGAGVGMAVYPINFFIAFIAWFAVLLTTKYMSLASISAGFVFAISAGSLMDDPWHRLLSIFVAIFITWTHRENIQRLRTGKEPPFL